MPFRGGTLRATRSPDRRGRAAVTAALLLVSAACGSDGAGPAVRTPVDTLTQRAPLRQAATARGLRVGAAADRLFKDDAEGQQFKALLAREFSMFTAENDMKHERLQPARGVFSFARADAMLAFAEANGMQMRGHTLVWHNQNASWLVNGTWTPAEARALLVEHITQVVTHYRGRIVAWDVVNEALNDDGTRRTGFWPDHAGADYIELAFRTAHAADPQARLFYNDYNIEGLGAKSDSAYALVQSLRAAGVPIHGIGFQGHFQAGGLPSRPALASNIARFAALGLEVHFTELDMRLRQPATAAQLATQAENYRDVFEVCMQNSACTAIVVWGVTDKDSWVPNTFTGWGDALLFDAQLRPKQAYWYVHDALTGR
jgi:endo-1,4-beta-xylanase